MGSSSSLIGEAVDRGVAELIESGPYFTDGVDLFRLVSVSSGSGGPRVVELEDCRTLEVSLYGGKALMRLGLSAVGLEAIEEDLR